MRRRDLVGAGLGSAAVSASARPAIARARRQGPPIVLVHGAWHGGWCWRDVRRQLEAAGRAVHAPTLTGLGERAHLLSPSVGLETHIADVTGLIEAEELADVVLCGHSYGGMVITGVCDRLKARVRHVVYLDAAVPRHGQSMASQGPETAPADVERQRAMFQAMAAGGLAIPPFADLTILGVPNDHSRAAWLRRRLTPHPLRTWFDPIELKVRGSEGLPRTYAHCVAPAMAGASFPAHARQIRKDPSWRYVELATGHDAMITAPNLVARLLLAAA